MIRQAWRRPEVPDLVEIDAGNYRCAVEGHDWATTGLYVGDVVCVPCRRDGCEAELRQNAAGQSEIRPFGFGLNAAGTLLKLEDHPLGGVAKVVCREIGTTYRLQDVEFKPGDRAVDVGAHVGAVSIFLAKKWPDIQVVALEPALDNYGRLRNNLRLNGAGNVLAARLAVTGDGRKVKLAGRGDWNSGGYSIYNVADGASQETVDSITLEQVWDLYGLDRVRLLKLDCEGAEFEILEADGGLLDRVEWLVMEVHRLPGVDDAKIQGLLNLVGRHVDSRKCRINLTGVGE